MRWLTLAMTAALVALVAFVALRDYAPGDGERAAAGSAARELGATLLDRGPDGRWRVRMRGGRCLAVDLGGFGADPVHGFHGVTPAACR